MKAIILAGGLGTRLGEETSTRPKPMVLIGERPIIWHIMKIYSAHGINDFVICLGYKGYMIKEYFANYFLHTSDVTFDLSNNNMTVHHNTAEPWRITLVDTGSECLTGGRLLRVKSYVDMDDVFCMTYGDGLSNVDVGALVEAHRKCKLLATLTGVRPPGRFGSLTLRGDIVDHFEEKPIGDGSWINGGFFVLSPKVFEFIDGDMISWEQEPLRRLAAAKQLNAYLHHGFWQPMDTLRDKVVLENLWEGGTAPWKIW